MTIFHDSRNILFRKPQGAMPCGEKLRLAVRAMVVDKVFLRLWCQDAETLYPMRQTSTDMYEYELTLPSDPGLVWYYFIAETESGKRYYLGNAGDGMGGVGDLYGNEPPSYQITVYNPNFDTPSWMRNGIMMQIMVDRFNGAGENDINNLPPSSYYHIRWDDTPGLVINDDKYGDSCNNDYFGGNLRGVQEKLDYIQNLGVTVLYFNPIFKARSNHKYNTGDYMQVDPSFGTEADFRALCQAAEDRGIRVILDGVFSHTGSDSLYFNRDLNYGTGGAYNDPNSPYASWYKFKSWPDDYESWWGFKTLPNVREEDEHYQNFIISDDDSVVAHWMRAGAAGWRLDVADELPLDFIRKIRTRMQAERNDSALIGEVWEDPSNKVAYGEMRCYCLGDTLDSTMNYPLRDAILNFMLGRTNAEAFVRRLENLRENLPLPFLYSEMNLLGSHDKPRAINVLADVGNMEPIRMYRYPVKLKPDDYAHGKRRLIAAWELVCALPGMPCIYYGDEAGLTGMADPYCRGTYPWGHEDIELMASFQDAIKNRRLSPALQTGNMKLTAFDGDVVLIERSIQNGQDVFGNPATDETRSLAVNRANEVRWIEYKGQTYKVPAESALRLN